MKKFICFIAFAGILGGTAVVANAQSKKAATQETITLVNGKVMVVKDGKQTALDKDVLMSDGRLFRPDGSIVNADGTLDQMKAGDVVALKPYAVKAQATPAKTK